MALMSGFNLKAKVGPLPLWGWGAVVAGGAFLLIEKGKGASGSGSGGQGTGKLPNYNTNSTLTQNIGDAYPVNQFGYGPSDSYISDSFFGSPLSLWTAGPMDYTGMFRDHRNRDRQDWDTGSGRRSGDRRRGRHDRDRDQRGGERGGDWGNGGGDGGRGGRQGGEGAFDNRGGSDNGFGNGTPPGSGGFGYHHSKGPRFPSAPSGGEGYDNGGQNFIGAGGGPARTGGNPYGQQTTQGTQGQQYLVQKGDTLNGIAQKLWGPGSDGDSIRQANNGSLGGGGQNGGLPQGLLLTIPGAPQSGPPAPGGPSGNGVGGGSISANGSNYGVGAAYGDHKGAGTSMAGASGGGSPTEGQSGGNSSRAKSGNASRDYATSQTGSDSEGSQRGRRSKYK